MKKTLLAILLAGTLCASATPAAADELDTIIDYLVQEREVELAKLSEQEAEKQNDRFAARARLAEPKESDSSTE